MSKSKSDDLFSTSSTTNDKDGSKASDHGRKTDNRDVMASTGVGSGDHDTKGESPVIPPVEGRIRNDDVIRDGGNVPVIVLNSQHQPVPMPGGVDNRKWAGIVQLSDTSWGILDIGTGGVGPTTYDSEERAQKAAKDHGLTVDASMNQDRRGKDPADKRSDRDKDGRPQQDRKQQDSGASKAH